jgi:hypothetical protein
VQLRTTEAAVNWNQRSLDLCERFPWNEAARMLGVSISGFIGKHGCELQLGYACQDPHLALN